MQYGWPMRTLRGRTSNLAMIRSGRSSSRAWMLSKATTVAAMAAVPVLVRPRKFTVAPARTRDNARVAGSLRSNAAAFASLRLLEWSQVAALGAPGALKTIDPVTRARAAMRWATVGWVAS